MAEGRFYWLKLKRDFFKRHDIRIIEAMPNGRDYILFYLKLLCESVDHEGELRFSQTIPYNSEMLSVITDTNADVVKGAIQVFTELGMMELLDDGTIFMTEVQKMIGSAADNENANRQRRFREAHKQMLEGGTALQNVTVSVTKNNESKSKNKSKSKSKSKNDNETASRFRAPTINEVKAYCQERGNKVDPQRWYDYYESNGWKVGRNGMKDWKAAVRTWERNGIDKRAPEPKQNAALNYEQRTYDDDEFQSGDYMREAEEFMRKQKEEGL